jgi:hypothetical protein
VSEFDGRGLVPDFAEIMADRFAEQREILSGENGASALLFVVHIHDPCLTP